ILISLSLALLPPLTHRHPRPTHSFPTRRSSDLAAKAVIRAAFEQVPDAVQDNLEKAGYERSAELLLTREITAEGKSTCRINGMRSEEHTCELQSSFDIG